MFEIGLHHKQAIIKLLNCVTNSLDSIGVSVNTFNTLNSITIKSINSQLFQQLAQIVAVYESVLNNNHNNENHFLSSDENQMIESIRDWLLSYYNCQHFINQLFVDIIDITHNQMNENFDSNKDNENEEKLWTISLLILNIIYKMRNSFIDLKMMLELGWICLSELDSSLDSLKPNYNKILSVLQKALNEEKRDNKEEIEKCDQLAQQVKQLRNKILDLQRKLIKVNKEKSLLGKNNNSLEFYSMSTHKLTSNASKRSANYDKEVTEEDSDSEQQTDSTSTIKRKSKVKAYKCEICTKMFATSYKLNRHMYSHTGLRPYSCLWPACHKQFNDNYHLKRHMLTHTGEKPYVCQSIGCTKRFARPEDLRHHQKSHLRESEEFINNECVPNNDISFGNDSNDI